MMAAKRSVIEDAGRPALITAGGTIAASFSGTLLVRMATKTAVKIDPTAVRKRNMIALRTH